MRFLKKSSELPQKSRVCLYGSGEAGKFIRYVLNTFRPDVKVVCYLDTFSSGKRDGINIVKIDEADKLRGCYDLILISSMYWREIEATLKKMKISNYMGIDPVFISLYHITSELEKSAGPYFSRMDVSSDSSQDLQKEKVLPYVDFSKTQNELLKGCKVKSGDIIKKVEANYLGRYLKEYIKQIKEDNQGGLERIFDDFDSIYTLDIFDKLTYSNDVITRVDTIIAQINETDNPLMVLEGQYYNNFTPIYQTLEKENYDVFLFCRDSHVSHISKNPAFELIPFTHKYLLNFPEMVYFLKSITKGVLLLNSESFHKPQFDSLSIISTYTYVSAISKIVRIPTILYLYDIINPFDKNFEYESDLIAIYKRMLNSVAGIILNSNTEEAGIFLRNTFNINKPILSFFRYNFYLKQSEFEEKLRDGFHLCMVGAFVDDVDDSARTVSGAVKELLSNHIHIHYYVNTTRTQLFYQSLYEEQKKYFHIHPSIMDQRELQKEVNKYHAGWMVHNTQGIVDIISNVKSQLLKDLIYMFKLTTVPSAIMLFGAAGLPTFINRSMQGLIKKYPSEFFIPMELSEVLSIKKIIKQKNWHHIYKELEEKREIFSIENNINSFVEFIEEVKKRARS